MHRGFAVRPHIWCVVVCAHGLHTKAKHLSSIGVRSPLAVLMERQCRRFVYVALVLFAFLCKLSHIDPMQSLRAQLRAAFRGRAVSFEPYAAPRDAAFVESLTACL